MENKKFWKLKKLPLLDFTGVKKIIHVYDENKEERYSSVFNINENMLHFFKKGKDFNYRILPKEYYLKFNNINLKRIAKFRYIFPLVYSNLEIDRYIGHSLIIMSSDYNNKISLPAEITEVIDKEITDENTYKNINIAGHKWR